MKKHTDESVKAGLQIEANDHLKHNAGTGYKDAAKETDADDLVHETSEEEEINTVNEEQDMDDLVHSFPVSKTALDNEERDADDLVHQNDEFPDE